MVNWTSLSEYFKLKLSSKKNKLFIIVIIITIILYISYALLKFTNISETLGWNEPLSSVGAFGSGIITIMFGLALIFGGPILIKNLLPNNAVQNNSVKIRRYMMIFMGIVCVLIGIMLLFYKPGVGISFNSLAP